MLEACCAGGLCKSPINEHPYAVCMAQKIAFVTFALKRSKLPEKTQ
jgi:hypothetical protein